MKKQNSEEKIEFKLLSLKKNPKKTIKKTILEQSKTKNQLKNTNIASKKAILFKKV